jgi:type I restriction enzyme, S subunit
VSTIGANCRFENGDRGKNYPGRKAFVPEGVPFVNAGHLENGLLDLSEMNFIPRDHFERLGAGKIRTGDLLFCLRGSLGKYAVVDNLDEGAIASSLVIVRPNETLAPRYLGHFFGSRLCSEEIAKYANGAAQPNLSAKSLAAFKIPLPPLEEQQRIVAILDAAFEGLARARANAEANLQNARELFLRCIEADFEALSKTHPRHKVGDIAVIKGGKRLPKGSKTVSAKTPFPYISIKDFNDQGSVDISGIEYLEPGVREAIKKYIICAEDLYISIAGTIGKTGIVPPELDGANLTENAARMVFKEGVDNEYVYFFTLTADFQDQAGLNTRTAAQPKLALERLKTISVPIASPDDQNSLVNKCYALREQTKQAEDRYSKKLADIFDLRQSLLQRAFAGELT